MDKPRLSRDRNDFSSRMHRFFTTFHKQLELHLMVLPGLAVVAVFSLFPLYGTLIAFQNFKISKGVFGSEWVGLKNFLFFLKDPMIPPILANTLALSTIKALMLFPLPLIFALMLNEARILSFRRTVQTVSYFPHFISWTVVSLIATTWLSGSYGFVNQFLIFLGILDKPHSFLGDPKDFWWISIILDIWKNIGYSSIIYLAAITAVNQEIIEAAVVDGAKRHHRILYIIIPSILPVTMVLFILNIGALLGGGLYSSNFTISYLLGNPLNISKSEILDTYVLKMGISQGRYSYATAVGLLSSMVSTTLLIAANQISKKTSGQSYF